MALFAVPIFLLLSLTSLARLVNVTIDDEYGDEHTGLRPRYEPDESANWLMMSAKKYPGSFDYSQVHNTTLHECFYMVGGNMTLTFNGTRPDRLAIYIFFVLNVDQDMDALFYLDGASRPSGNYTRPATPTSDEIDNHVYNQLVYSRAALAYGTHSLSVLFSLTANEFFDYALYTTDDGRAPERSTTTGSQVSQSPGPSAKLVPSATVTPHRSYKLGPAVGASLAGTVLVTAFCIWVVFRLRRRRAADSRTPGMIGRTAAASGRDGIVPFEFSAPPSEPVLGATSCTGTIDDSEKSQNPLKQAGGGLRANVPSATQGAPLPAQSSHSESIAFFLAELERVRAERERAMAENERMREENELLRRVAVPPPYSDGGRSNVVDQDLV